MRSAGQSGKKSHMLFRMVRRDIKDTFGRFFAVFAIIAIGTGFFSGVRITTPVMLHTMNGYLKEHRLFDYRLISTLGWEESEVSRFRNEEGVSAAEGAWQMDVICLREDGTESVFKVHSITDSLNTIRIKDGRLPENDRECVLDADCSEWFSLNEKISFSEGNDPDTLETFSGWEYTVVGFADSPLYINFERGTTSIGNGSVLGFMYLLPEAFDSDVYTEVYVKLDTDHEIYSDMYREQMDDLRPKWEDITQKAAESRYSRLYDDAAAELENAKAEFEDEKEEGKQKLLDAADELKNGKTELEDAADQLSDGRAELEDAAEQLAGAKQELDDAAEQLKDGKQELDSARKALVDSAMQLEAAQAELAAAKEELDSSGDQLRTYEAQLKTSRVQLDNAAEELATAKGQLDQTEEELTAAQTELAAKEAEIRTARAADIIDEETASAALAEIAAKNEELNAGRVQYESAVSQYQASLSEYEAGEAQYKQGLSEYEAGKAAYDNGVNEYNSGLEQYNAGRARYEEGLAAYKEAVEKYNEGEASYLNGLMEYDQAVSDYEQGLKDYDNGLAEYQDGLAEYQEGLAEYANAKENFDTEIADAQKKLDDAQAELDDFEKPDTYLLERGTNIGYACFENDSEIVGQIARILPLFFILVAVLVCMTTMTRMVDERRGQIGIMKGLGYSAADIMFTFLAYAGSASVLGCIFGYAVGILLFPGVIWYVYHIMYINIPISYCIDWKLAAAVFAVSVAATLITTYLTCRSELKESAAELLRPRAPKAGKRVFLEKIPFIWSRMKFMVKVSARNILRYKKRFFMMIVGISGCTALLMTGFGLNDTIATFVKTQFEDIQIAQADLVMDRTGGAELPAELKAAMDEIGASYHTYDQASWDLILENRTKSVTMLTFPEWNDLGQFFRLRTMKGEEITSLPEGEALVSISISRRYGVNEGDVIELRNEDMKTVKVTVGGVFENHVYNYVIVSQDTMAAAGFGRSINGAYVNFPEGSDIYKAQAELASCRGVISVSVFADMVERLSGMMSSLNYVVLLIIISAAALAFVVLYNLTNINILERIREIATIKVLGFQRRETSQYVFRENVVLTAIGTALGLGLGILLHSFVIDQINVDLVYFKKEITPLSFIFSVLLTFSFTFLVNGIMSFKLEKINMAESLKSVE